MSEHKHSRWSGEQVRFLSFPGEIRNLIYDLCKQHSSISLYRRARPKPNYAPSLPDSNQGNRRSFDRHEFDLTRPSKYRGLTQACKQIRAEFRPIYMRNTEVWVTLQDMTKFMTDFIDLDLPVTNLVIDTGYFNPETHVDLSALIQAHWSSSPDVKIRFDDRSIRLTKTWEDIAHLELNKLLIEPEGHNGWHKYLKNAVTNVFLADNFGVEPTVTFRVADGYDTEWIGEDGLEGKETNACFEVVGYHWVDVYLSVPKLKSDRAYMRRVDKAVGWLLKEGKKDLAMRIFPWYPKSFGIPWKW